MDGGKCFGVDFKFQLGRQADRAQQTQMVLRKPFAWVTDGAHDFRAQIGFALDPVAKLVLQRIVEQPVDGKVAAERVGLRIAEAHAIRMAAILIVGVRPKGRYLTFLGAFHDDDDAELAPDRDGFWK